MKKGKMINSPLFSLYYLKREGVSYAAVASKKVSKKAVIRNRNKRRVREIMRRNASNTPKGFFIVFIKKDMAHLPHAAIKEELLSVVRKFE